MSKKEEKVEMTVADAVTNFIAFGLNPAMESTNNAALIAAANEMVHGKSSRFHCEKITLPEYVDGEMRSIARAEYDAGVVDTAAFTFIAERAYAALCRDLHYGIQYSEKQIATATKRIASMQMLMRRKPSDKLESDLIERITWLTLQKAQIGYRQQLLTHVAMPLYKEATGLEWCPPEDTEVVDTGLQTEAEALLLSA